MRKLTWFFALFLCILLGYLIACSSAPSENKAASDTTAPVLTVTTPTNGQEIGSVFTIYGTVSDDSSGVDKVFVKYGTNEYSEAMVSNGIWATNLDAGSTMGTNTNLVYATDKSGNASSITMIILNRQAIPMITITNVTMGQILSNATKRIRGIFGIDSPFTVNQVNVFRINGMVTNNFSGDTSGDPEWRCDVNFQPDTNWIIVSAVGDNGRSNYSAPMMVVRDAYGPITGNNGTVNISTVLENSLWVSWQKANDNYTAQSELQYCVLASNTTRGVIDYNSGWSQDASSCQAFNLGLCSNYTIYTLVRDGVGNISNYNTRTQTMPDLTPPLPTNLGPITIANKSSNSFDIIWERANDNWTPKDQVQYLAVWSYSSNLTNAVMAEAYGNAFYGWSSNSQNIITNSLTGLSMGTTYYVNIIAKDLADNMSVYTIKGVMTMGSADDPLPVPGNSGTINLSTNIGYTVNINWAKATDVNTSQANLQYRLYVSSNFMMSTVDDITNNGAPVTGWTSDMTNFNGAGPLGGMCMMYYYNVLVKDASGNTTNYVQSSIMGPM